MSNERKNLHTALAVIAVLLLAGILYMVYTQYNSTDKYYKETLTSAESYIQEENWDMALYELKKLDSIEPRDKKLIEKKDIDVSSCNVHKVLENPTDIDTDDTN